MSETRGGFSPMSRISNLGSCQYRIVAMSFDFGTLYLWRIHQTLTVGYIEEDVNTRDFDCRAW